MGKQRKVTARKWNGDDAYSWAVFVQGQTEPVVSGLKRSEVEYHKRRVVEMLDKKSPGITWQVWMERAIKAAVEAWLPKQQVDPYGHFHLWARPGSIKITTDDPGDGHEMATAERIPPSCTKDEAYRWCKHHLQGVPCLPSDEELALMS